MKIYFRWDQYNFFSLEGQNNQIDWYLFVWTLGILKVACQKKPQEDGRGGEGGKADNIGGEVGLIPPYPTFIPPGLKKLFRQWAT